ncbi:MAG: hypothetical protein A2X49_13280 [Lentisphaerae bacterium GWF2_52_8]|nr:MAG: hypothetical protein A2X49_13280 [Lentisphaerae bacterium GWF2_52_8]
MDAEFTSRVEREERDLAPYALRCLESKGRRHPEQAHPFRNDFQRDRDRILHSRSFRRLEYKTQVFLNGTGDHLRTRLTHTIEVAAICRTIARALNLNEHLAETVALAHDLGHTPFGHSGERAMNRIMAGHGGFDHNAQALRVVDLLEIKYPSYDGLNLTWEVRCGLMKHRMGTANSLDGIMLPPQPSLEAQVADLGDDLTYYGHDVDDGLEAGLIDEGMLRNLRLWELAASQSRAAGLLDGQERFRAYTVRCLIDMMVGDVVRASSSKIAEACISSPTAAQELEHKLICFSPEFGEMATELRKFLYNNVYFHDEVEKINEASVARMEQLFNVYVSQPELMGAQARTRIPGEGLHRVVADYIAGMTDRFALIEYERCCGSELKPSGTDRPPFFRN